jgi:hypothetical protein
MGQTLSAWAECKAAEVAKQILAEEIGLLEGCRYLVKLFGSFSEQGDPMLLPIIAFESETEWIPTGDLRALWNPRSLALKEQEVAGYLAAMEGPIRDVCRYLIERYAPSKEGGAKSQIDEAAETILGFVRGDNSWEALTRTEINVVSKDEGFEVDNPGSLIVKPCLRDLAQGLLVHQPMPDQLQMWAAIILAGSSFLDLREAFDVTPEGDILLNALRDAAFEQEVGEEALKVAENLIRQGKAIS